MAVEKAIRSKGRCPGKSAWGGSPGPPAGAPGPPAGIVDRAERRILEIETWIAEARSLADAAVQLRRLGALVDASPGALALVNSVLKVVDGAARG